jgi:hypothetical protein
MDTKLGLTMYLFSLKRFHNNLKEGCIAILLTVIRCQKETNTYETWMTSHVHVILSYPILWASTKHTDRDKAKEPIDITCTPETNHSHIKPSAHHASTNIGQSGIHEKKQGRRAYPSPAPHSCHQCFIFKGTLETHHLHLLVFNHVSR